MAGALQAWLRAEPLSAPGGKKGSPRNKVQGLGPFLGGPRDKD